MKENKLPIQAGIYGWMGSVFFEDYLIQNTKDNYFAYSKSKLHSFYTMRENSVKIIALIAVNMPKPNHEEV